MNQNKETLEAVTEIYSKLVENSSSNSAEAYANLGSLYAQQQQWQEAIAAYQQAIKLNPYFAGAYRNLARVLTQIENNNLATDYWYAAFSLEESWGNAEDYYNLGKNLQEQNKLHKAAICYRQAIKLNPDLKEAYYCLGEILTKEKQEQELKYQDTIDRLTNCYIQLIKIAPESSTVYVHLVDILNQQKQWKNLLENQTVITEQHYYQLGETFRSTSQFSEAIYCYQKSLQINPNFWQSYYSLQYIFIPAKELDTTIACYKNILQKNPQLYLAWGNLGDVFTEKGEVTEAIKCYQKSSYLKNIQSRPQLAKLPWPKQKEKGPDFIIIGAAKCGTSSLYLYLNHHPQILLPHKKELNFFWKYFQHGSPWYLANFPTIADTDDFLTGEASPNYFDYVAPPERVYKLFPQVKSIVLLRNPIDRAISWHYHQMRSGFAKQDLITAIDIEMAELDDLSEADLIKTDYRKNNNLLGSLYLYKLKRWMQFFPPEQFLIIKSEDFYDNPTATMKDVYHFLGLPEHDFKKYVKSNAGEYPEISPILRQKLRKYFQPHNQKLEDFLGRKFNWE